MDCIKLALDTLRLGGLPQGVVLYPALKPKVSNETCAQHLDGYG